jgi:hypothetical protein
MKKIVGEEKRDKKREWKMRRPRPESQRENKQSES